MVDSARGELKTCLGNSVESFCVRRNTPPLGSSMSSPNRMRPGSCSKPARSVLFTVSPMRYFPGGRISFWIFGFFRFAIFLTNAFLNFAVESREIIRSNDTFLDQLILPTFERIEFFKLPQFLFASIKFLIIGTGVAG